MRSARLLFPFLPIFLILSCKKQTPAETQDNIYEFREYISYTTFGPQSIGSEIRVVLSKPLESAELDQELPAEFLVLKPAVAGKLVVSNANTLLFQPDKPLEPGTEYLATLQLHKLFPGIAQNLRTYSFAFSTLAPNFKIDLLELQSYDPNWQYLKGSLQGADLLPAGKVQQIIRAEAGGSPLTLQWEGTEDMGQYFNFTIDSIPRKKQDYEIRIFWDGEAVGADNQGEAAFPIPGKDRFVVVRTKTTSGSNPMLSLNFSEPLDPNQNLSGLVTIENAPELRYEIVGNVLHVYPLQALTGQVQVQVFDGVKSQYGAALSQPYSEWVSFEPLKPEVRLISKGTILPEADKTPIYFETVNLSAVEVRVIQIYQDNILQHLQQNDLGNGYEYDLRHVGRRVAFKVLDLGKDAGANQWKAHALDLSELLKPNPGSLYRVEFSIKPAYSLYNCEDQPALAEPADDTEYYYEDEEYQEEVFVADSREEEEAREQQFWDNQLNSWRRYQYNWQERDNPCHPAYYNSDRDVYTHLLGSNLGLIVKEGNNNTYHVFTTDLLTAQPQPGSVVTFYNFQQQPLAQRTADADGKVVYNAAHAVAFVVAEKDKNVAYAKLDDGNALSLSKFDVSGSELQRGLQGFVYTERGVHRPGDTLHLTFVLNDKHNPLPANHPVVLEVTDPLGKLVQRTVVSGEAAGSSKGARKQGSFYYFPIATAPDAPTGNWHARVLVGGAQFNRLLKIATVKPNRLKIDLNFDQAILESEKSNTGEATVSWLHGAPARNLKFEMDLTLKSAGDAFPKFKDFTFTDPVRSFTESESKFFEGTLSEAGKVRFSQKIPVNAKAPGMLQAVFTTRAYEGGGDFSMDVHAKNLAPFTHFAGLKAPQPDRYGSYPTNTPTAFQVQTVDAAGNPSGRRELEVQLFKIEWRWWWNRGYDNLSRYENAQVHRPMQSFTLTTQNDGKGRFEISVPEAEGGRYLVRVLDRASGHATGTTAYFYKDWLNRPADGDSESAKTLLFVTDKERYNTGEEAVVTFPSSAGDKALISLENGSEVLSAKWVTTEAGETRVRIPITPDMAPNVFVNITLLQPHGSVDNDLPIRLYGIVPMLVENPETRLRPTLQMADVLKPEEPFTLKVSEAGGKPMTYTVAVVDEGLLDLTRFATPDIHQAFYARQALGVKSFDVFDDVMGSYSVSVGNIYAIGGGDLAPGAKNRKAQRFKPVVRFLGPFELKAGQTASHTVYMPNYTGAVKTMVIAGNGQSAYGHTDKSTPVRKPLMVLASVPRKLSPGEKVTVPVTVFAMEAKIKEVQVAVKAGRSLKPLGPSTATLRFSGLGEQMAYFEFEVLPEPGIAHIAVEASGAGETAKTALELDVENPNPVTSQSTTYELKPGATLEVAFDTFGTPGTNAATLELSTLPPMDLEKRLDYLVRYPHGCIEQITSAALPQLFLPELLDLPANRKQDMETNIRAAIRKIGDRQMAGGGLAYWPGNPYPDDWGTSYAGLFMLEARNKGHALPLTFLSNWTRYQKQAARQWNRQQHPYNTDLAQAFRLYTLALAGEPELAAMNRLRESKNLSDNAKWRLAAAYALLGKDQIAKDLAARASLDLVPSPDDPYSYGSDFRNKALALETLVALGDNGQHELARSLGRSLNSARWYSTQETAYALLALSKMVLKNGGKEIDLTLDDQPVKSSKPLAQRPLALRAGRNTHRLANRQNNVVYATLVQFGKLPTGSELAESRGLQVATAYQDGAGAPLDISTVVQGSDIRARVVVTNTTGDAIRNVALTQLFPSGWEIVNTSFTELGTPNASQSDYVDIRDDRVQYYFDLGGRESKVFTIKLNASFIGRYYLPGAQAEAMYDNAYFARNQGQWIHVRQ